jgi:hypothetical protein
MLKKKAGSHKVKWVKRQVRAYLIKEQQFLQKLIICIYMINRQSARKPKLGLIKIYNNIYLA